MHSPKVPRRREFCRCVLSLVISISILFPTLAAPPAASAQTTAPTAPSGLTATAITHNKIDLTWVDNSNNEDEFKIHRSTDGKIFNQIATVKADITAYRDAGLKASTWYTYTVSAYNVIGDSAFSNEADDITKRPGETDPAIDYYEWREDEIFLT